jgi:succinate dehydrogenase / fumarate reductase, flavoprotein subunit
VHYTMGGLWVDYNLMSNIPGLFVIGEANFSDHGANRLGASALMQGLADGYFILPYTIGNYLAKCGWDKISPDTADFKGAVRETEDRIQTLINIKGKRTPDSIHRELGLVLWDFVGMSRNEAGLQKAISRIPELREEFWSNLKLSGGANELNISLEKALRVAEFLDLADIMARDALQRNESCGGHFREEFQTEEGEAMRNDKDFAYTGVWEYKGPGQTPVLHKEMLEFASVKLSQRNYK